ncbi:MAG TPA: cytochrome d ubiquinol oxidase subunit II [Propionibacteriaceae bacterium]|nr:cytochrome d ubiquinol oxidase subunit II [Propionibacteriaceae bacterium]
MTLLEYTVNPSIWQGLWLVLVAVLWMGYFLLEGFDYGVGMLLGFFTKDEKEKRLLVNTIGPVWDGNEVWLLTAGGAIFAAFSGWYATLFSALYLPLLLVLVGLILRGVAFEYRGKQTDPTWRRRWDLAAAIGSFIPSLVFGVGFANLLGGLKLEAVTSNLSGNLVPLLAGDFVQRFFMLFLPFALLGGVLFVSLFLTHGAIFAALKTKGDFHDRVEAFAVKSGFVTVPLLAIFVVWANLHPMLPGQTSVLRTVAWVVGVLSLALVAGAVFLAKQTRDKLAFVCSSLGVLLLTVMFFCHFYPGLGFDNTATVAAGAPLDLTTASSSEGTLQIMTVAAVLLVPVVLGYQIWTYKVFSRRLGTQNIPDDVPEPVEAGAKG